MYDIKKPFKFDIKTEICAMEQFLAPRWTNFKGISKLLEVIASVAENDARSAIADMELRRYLMDQRKARDSVLMSFDESSGMLRYYDQVAVLVEGLDHEVGKVQSHSNETLYKAYASAMKKFKKALAAPDMAHLKKAKPVGLAEMTESHYKNDDAWDAALSDEFHSRGAFAGADTASASHGGFVSAVNLTMVVQILDNHHTAPIDQLIQGAYRHFVDVYRALNTHAVIADLDQLSSQIAAAKGIFEVQFAPTHKLTKVLWALAKAHNSELSSANPEQDYMEAVAERMAAKPLTEEERKARRAEAARMVSKMLKDALKPETTEQAKAREAERERDRQAVDTLLQSL